MHSFRCILNFLFSYFVAGLRGDIFSYGIRVNIGINQRSLKYNNETKTDLIVTNHSTRE